MNKMDILSSNIPYLEVEADNKQVLSHYHQL